MQSLKYNMKNYTKFDGRACRAEFWWFFLAYYILTFVTCGVAYVAFLIPLIACGFRRVHDAGKPGWFFLIPIYGLILTLTPSAPANEYGEGAASPEA